MHNVGRDCKGRWYRYIPQGLTAEDFCKHIRLYVLNGVLPTPHMELKINSQTRDKVHGNDYVYGAFGIDGRRKHKMLGEVVVYGRVSSNLKDLVLISR